MNWVAYPTKEHISSCFLIGAKKQKSREGVQCIEKECFCWSEKHSVQINGIAIHIVRISLYQEVSQFFMEGMVNFGSAGVGSYQHAMMGGKPKLFLPKEASSPILSEKFSWSHLYCHCLQVDLANEIMVHWIVWYLNLLCKVTVYFDLRSVWWIYSKGFPATAWSGIIWWNS